MIPDDQTQSTPPSPAVPDPKLKPGEYLVTRHELSEPKPCADGRCLKPIVWVLSKKGSRVPLSVSTAQLVRCHVCMDPAEGAPRPICARCASTGELYVVLTHFADCVGARGFRKKP